MLFWYKKSEVEKEQKKRRGGEREREEKVEPPIPLFCKPNLKL